MNINYKKDWLKFIIGWVVCFGLRMIPFRPPNVEPILTTTMPFSKKYGWLAGFSFGFLSLIFFDLATLKLGIWSLITATCYGFLGVGAYFFFKNRKSTSLNYLKYAVVGTIAYDALTGLTIGPLFFKMPFMIALIGQIPFTLWHLAGNVVLSVTLSPFLYRWVLENRNLDPNVIWGKLFKTAL